MNIKSLVARLDELLRSHGFKRKKHTWNRSTGSFVDVIDVQQSKSGDAFTLNIGVTYAPIHRLCWGEPPDCYQEPSCVVRSRIGPLIDNNRLDLWWRLENAAEPDLDAIMNCVKLNVFPFLSRMHSLEAMERYLLDARVTRQAYPPPILYLSILMHERGDKDAACDTLVEIRKKAGPSWHEKIDIIARALACQKIVSF